MANFYIGLDLGQVQDYTALTIVERVESEYHVRHLERVKLGTPYPAIVERVKGLVNSSQLKGQTALVVDKTGVGAPVVDMFDIAGMRPAAITITGGDSVGKDEYGYRVPKRDLVTTLQVLLQANRLKIAAGLPLAPVLMDEMLNFKVKIDIRTAHDSYAAWREGAHDDLVLAVALACWYAEQQPPALDPEIVKLFRNASFYGQSIRGRYAFLNPF